MEDKIRFYLSRMSEKLWIKPLVVCFLSIAAAFVAQAVDQLPMLERVPEVTLDSIKMLLEIISASMLVMAVFAVGSMLAAYQSASSSATPRAFSLVVSDDISQNALSTFIGAFIFSIVAQVSLMNGYYDKAGRFILFLITIVVFALVIFSFIRWVDGIARLGRLGTTIKKVETAAGEALLRRRDRPFLGGTESSGAEAGMPFFSDAVGYVQRIDMDYLQSVAEQREARIEIAVLAGTFITRNKPLAYVVADDNKNAGRIVQCDLAKGFVIGDLRTFDDDPRFGLITLSEIASRALSPAVNDPGTAIEITGTFVRLFTEFSRPVEKIEHPDVGYDRIAVPAISMSDLFEDAFGAIARDGAATVEVVIRVLKALESLTEVGDERMKKAALKAASLVFAHAENALQIPSEIETLNAVSAFAR